MTRDWVRREVGRTAEPEGTSCLIEKKLWLNMTDEWCCETRHNRITPNTRTERLHNENSQRCRLGEWNWIFAFEYARWMATTHVWKQIKNDDFLRNRLPVGGGCVYVLQLFFCFFFCFFSDRQIWDNRSRERLNGFSWNFQQTIGGNVVWNVVPPLGESRAEWRMLMLCVIYDMTLAESPEGANGGCVIQQWAGELM